MKHTITTSLRSLVLAVSFSVVGCGGEFAFDEEIATESEAVMTAFDPEVHGFRFENTFRNNFISGAGIEMDTKGLCGGMVYSILDYYEAGIARPAQNYLPGTGTTLRHHIYARQVDSLESNVDKWTEIMFNPFGLRDSEFFRWGLQKDARVKELRAALDAGDPVPLGMKALGSFTGGHQVLAIGYTLGAYDSAWLGYPNMKIMVYDPDFAHEIRTLVPNLTGGYWMDSQDTSRRWLTYFVDANYTRVAVPNFTSIAKGMLFRIKTGADDLQGGSNNLALTLKNKAGSIIYSNGNINASDRWVTGSEETFAVALSNPQDVATVELRALFPDRWLNEGWYIRNISSSVQSSPRATRDFEPAVHFGTGGLTTSILPLPEMLVRALNGDFADGAKDDSHIVYNTWGGATYCAEVHGNVFWHAPYSTFCDWKKGHEDTIINYQSWDGFDWTATLNGKTFTHTKRNSSQPPHQATVLSYKRGSDQWQFKVK